jgi:hypothetical protein
MLPDRACASTACIDTDPSFKGHPEFPRACPAQFPKARNVTTGLELKPTSGCLRPP